jgi:hypothetical protein
MRLALTSFLQKVQTRTTYLRHRTSTSFEAASCLADVMAWV